MFNFNNWLQNVKKNKSVIEVEKEEVDEQGNIIDKKMKSLEKFKKSHNY